MKQTVAGSMRRSRRRMTRVAAAVVAGLAMLAAGCAKPKPEIKPPDYIVVAGDSKIDFEAYLTPDQRRSLRSRTFQGVGESPLGDGMPSRPIQSVFGRAQARREALKAMAGEILNAQTDAGQTVAQALESQADRAKLERLLQNSAKLEYQAEGADRIAARATLESETLENGFGITLGYAVNPIQVMSGTQLQEIQRKSRDEAAVEARGKMIEAMRTTPLRGGRTFGDEMERDAALGAAIKSRVDNLPPDDVEFERDGTCTVTYYFDRNRLQAEVDSRKKGWF
jgi:hypothetical protein